MRMTGISLLLLLSPDMPEDHPRPTCSAEFRCYEELNDFLPEEQRKISFRHSFHGTPSIKDTVIMHLTNS